MKALKLAIMLAVLGVALFSGCVSPATDNTESSIDAASGATKSRFREGEITEYEGFKLDPAIGPRDNSINGVQHVDIDTYKLEISGLVDTPIELTYDDVLKLDSYERKITLYCVEGWNATILWKGVLIEDILDQSGIGEDANTVIFHSVDGYTTSLPLETVISNKLILAYNANNLPLPDEMGYPFIVVAESKLGYKWARWVSGIELSDDPDYLGYWEERGYDNDADLNYQQFSRN
jgi:DMSO/TMAO reductase YedYZ molybdopterin-dependent catalytic subunit